MFIDDLAKCYKECFNEKIKEHPQSKITDLKDPKYKVLLVTVNNNEFYAVMMQLKDYKAEKYIGNDPVCNSYSYYFVGEWGKVPVVIIQTCMSSNGVNSSWYETKKALHLMPQLKYIFAVGVCGGVSTKVHLGDVVISKAIQGYADLKMTAFGWIIRSVHALCAQTKVYYSFTQAANTLPDGIVAKDGVVLSGPWLIADVETQQNLLKLSKDAIAFEMEGANIAQACGQTPVECLVVKGVSDLADKDKDDDWQPQAATNAAIYLYERLNKYHFLFAVSQLVKCTHY